VAEENLNTKQRHFFIREKREVPAVREEIVGCLVSLGYSQRDLFAVRLATEEVLLNAIEHGNKSDKTKKVAVAYAIDGEKAEITVADEGPGFDPSSVADCTSPDNLCKTRGRGIALMRGFMDVVEFPGKGNTVRLVKFKTAPDTVPTCPEQSR
jgi:serine/threonine-protein kinase RsbW